MSPLSSVSPARVTTALAAVFLCLTSHATAQSSRVSSLRKLDRELSERLTQRQSWRRSRVVVQVEAGQSLPPSLRIFQKGNRLDLINGYVLEVPDAAIDQVVAPNSVRSAHFDRPIWAADYLSTHATAADVVQQARYRGAGIGIAVIDSGVTAWHDDLMAGGRNNRTHPYGNQRVSKFVDFVGGGRQPYDDHGHGSHVAGIILGNGHDSDGKHAGMAPDASLIALKVLDKDGKGTISNFIAALDWVAANAKTHNIRVVNVSAGSWVTESYWTDPMTLAAKRLVEQGIVVVAAAGNLGRNAQGEEQYGGILCPGNAPWVLTVGASSTLGTVRRNDDVRARFSSNGPTRGDYTAKPDLLAPGYGILSLAVPDSTLFVGNPQFLVPGTERTAHPPYLSLSGTSMAAPQVTGAVALMLEANPKLTPNLVKGILQYTAQSYPEYNPLQQGTGFLDVLSAVRLSLFYAQNRPGSQMPVRESWSQSLLWGTHLLSGGYINPRANAWAVTTTWGADALMDDDNIVWGTSCDDCDNIVWGTNDADGDNIVWGTDADDNIVWGTIHGDDDNIVWGTNGDDNIVWGTDGDDNIVWGTTGWDDNIVWGTDCGGLDCDNIVWGTNGDDNIVWGTADWDDNIVWGTDGDDNIVWGTDGDDNIVWGTDGDDNIVWGTNGDDNIVWGTTGWDDNIVWGTSGDDNIVWGTAVDEQALWGRGGRFDAGERAAQKFSRMTRRR
jgi:subtilisin family serine protease